MTGLVHSIETLGTVDGPGIRFVLFLQGCPLRCLYCHNPDTWEVGIGKEMTVEEILREFESNKHYYVNGGITVTGGEALLQIDFLIELFEECKKREIHTCLDTSGVTFNNSNPKFLEKLDKMLTYTDLILLDIKHIDYEEHRKLTGFGNRNILEFARYLSYLKIPVWIRHVVIPTVTDNPKYWYELGYFLGELRNIKALDVLPYHTMGVVKYQQMGLKYPLDGIESAPKELAQEATQVIYSALRQKRMDMRKAAK